MSLAAKASGPCIQHRWDRPTAYVTLTGPQKPCRRFSQTRHWTPRIRADVTAQPTTPGIEKSFTAPKAVKDIDTIMKTLPHRYPFLLVDRVVEFEQGKYAIGYKNVTINDNFFTGHFPERPIMPGVLQIEAMAQLAGIVMLDPNDAAGKGLFFFGGIDNCRFRKPVVPGDTLVMRSEVTKYNKRFGVVKIDAKGYVGNELVVEAELTLAMAKQGA